MEAGVGAELVLGDVLGYSRSQCDNRSIKAITYRMLIGVISLDFISSYPLATL